MTKPMLCPTCKSNRMRFTIIEQVPRYMRLDPQTGEVVQQLSSEELDIFHQPYKGDSYMIQCGVCGTTESEERFVKMAEHMQTQRSQ
ncbi:MULTISPECIES: hypothetical protein [Brevibacillus]|jgi:hypothetical protein|uniref:DNA alkylation repair protein n=1 Tax=Brevibacillus parabrevis TaxID=54914 RepID=A0A4Y3PDS4_BREPA|nr:MULTISPECIES: hypothetical protein [Brevibacillus]TGV27309.1 hypothetical protein EN829_042795 [Mesorhizobium sp. M00.F.Ca.ET.186.01.1.1]MBU8711939.1 hypothetical protein [Brevibacillus parabrevis]MDH6349002.1 hypothetical protein [Brevibacillus sp. 1238]MDR5001018.1 hypothetical protein [Brevibacillus parabrevis]MED1724010.1 hypothetical protein [Brevibacillus parabrevis]